MPPPNHGSDSFSYHRASEEYMYASWLRKLDKDDGMQGKGIKFAEKLVGKPGTSSNGTWEVSVGRAQAVVHTLVS